LEFNPLAPICLSYVDLVVAELILALSALTLLFVVLDVSETELDLASVTDDLVLLVNSEDYPVDVHKLRVFY
jgi:hypothetical protein